MKAARVVIERAARSYDKEYDYLIPEGMTVCAGCRAAVPFGAGNRPRVALVISVMEISESSENAPRMKRLFSVIDREPLIGDEGLYLLRALRATAFCGWFEALSVLVPPGMGAQVKMSLIPNRGRFDEAQALSLEAQRLYGYLCSQKKATEQQKALEQMGLVQNHPALEELLNGGFVTRSRMIKKKIADERTVMARLTEKSLDGQKLSDKQRAVAELLYQTGCASVREIMYFTGVGRSVVMALQNKGFVELFEEVTPHKTADKAEVVTDTAPIILSESQQKAFDILYNDLKSEKYAVSLLHGVTGSGKTQVFLRLIEETLSMGRQAIVLIPEISLTPQTVKRFSSRFGARVAVLHSSLSMTERLDEWQRIRDGRADIVVGTRSAVFAPLKNIGIIVIDEEQEHTYHSESSPRYHARDIAKIRAKYHGAQLLLCSATPSVESYYAAKNGEYTLAELTERYSGNELPEVMTIDMRNSPKSAASDTMSEELCEQMRETLERGEQSILLLNRRGYNTLVKCSECGEAASCPNCSIPLIYHSANHRLVCHYCGYSVSESAPCSSCGSKMLRHTGSGTQRIEEELHTVFPEARVLRMDMDTTMSRFSHQRGFEAFSRGEYDIMIGTQMVAKGLDFPNVTLVGVLSADQSLYGDDFRGFERTFSLITQVVGRCGRADKPGRAAIQTFSPDNRILALAAAQDYKAFYAEEINYRRIGLYPPFCSMACVAFWDESEKIVTDSAESYTAQFKKIAAENYPRIPIRLLGPVACTPYRVGGRYRYRLLIKCRNDKTTRQLFLDMQSWYDRQKNTALMTMDMYYDSNL